MSEQDDVKPAGADKPASQADKAAKPGPSTVPSTETGRDDRGSIGARGAARRRRGRVLAVLILVVIVFAVGVAAGVVYAPQLARVLPSESARGAAPEPVPELAAIEDRLRALEAGSGQPDPALVRAASDIDRMTAELARLGAGLGEVEGRFAALEGLTARIEALESAPAQPSGEADLTAALERLAALEASAVPAAGAAESGFTPTFEDLDLLSASVAATQERLAALESETDPARMRRLAFALSVAELRKAIRGADPYRTDLEAVRKLSLDAEELVTPEVMGAIDALAAHAATGIPTAETLHRRFVSLAPEIVRHAGREDGAGWIDQAIDRLTSIVTVRRTGEVAGESVEARIARAEQRLEAWQLARAVDEIAGLDGAPSRIAAPWLADAKARLAAERALDDLSEHALVQLSPQVSTE